MAPRPNWRKIADDLAGRLMHQAGCAQHCGEPLVPGCPFCEDTAAYERYLAAGGTVRPPSYPGATRVTLAELSRRGDTTT